MTGYDDDPMYCRTCRRALARLTPSGGGPVSYRHHARLTSDPGEPPHDPDPVPLSQLPDARMRCDFCSTDDPTWSYLAAEQITHNRRVVSHSVAISELRDKGWAARRQNVRTEATGSGSNLGQRWAACQGCAALIEAADVLGLVSRVVDSLPAKAVRGKKLLAVRGELIDTYEHLLGTLVRDSDTRAGRPIRPAAESDDRN